jgi:amino acid transporter
VAIVVYSTAAALFGNLGGFDRLADIANVAVVAQYLATCAAVPLLRRMHARTPGAPPPRFRLPFGPLVPLAALAACAAFLGSVQPSEAKVAAAILAVGFVLRAALVGWRFARR